MATLQPMLPTAPSMCDTTWFQPEPHALSNTCRKRHKSKLGSMREETTSLTQYPVATGRPRQETCRLLGQDGRRRSQYAETRTPKPSRTSATLLITQQGSSGFKSCFPAAAAMPLPCMQPELSQFLKAIRSTRTHLNYSSRAEGGCRIEIPSTQE